MRPFLLSGASHRRKLKPSPSFGAKRGSAAGLDGGGGAIGGGGGSGLSICGGGGAGGGSLIGVGVALGGVFGAGLAFVGEAVTALPTFGATFGADLTTALAGSAGVVEAAVVLLPATAAASGSGVPGGGRGPTFGGLPDGSAVSASKASTSSCQLGSGFSFPNTSWRSAGSMSLTI